MAAFSDVGARCAEPSCGQQTFLPFTCNGCSGLFCEEHVHYSAHGCSATPAAVEPSREPSAAAPESKRCAVKGCQERLASHNTVRCWRCNQNVCIRHRFEDDHPCITVQEAVANALAMARNVMPPAEFADAQETLERIFGNILKEPTNEKFRSLKKENKIVKEKLNHPACIEALKLCGFTDMGETFTCPLVADLSLMRKMHVALKPSSVASEGSGPRMVNGVIVRPPPQQKTPTPAAATANLPQSSSSCAGVKKQAAKSAFDFQRRQQPDQQAQAQNAALTGLRQMQKEKYKADTGSGNPIGGYPSSSAGAQPKAKAQPKAQLAQQQDCTLQ